MCLGTHLPCLLHPIDKSRSDGIIFVLSMRPISLVDALFLALERPHQPMHVMALCVFDLPESASCDFVKGLYSAMLDASYAPSHPFNIVLRGGFWCAHHPNLGAHCTYHTLEGGGFEALHAYAATLHEGQMESGVLWRCHLIEGFLPGKFALGLQMHHALGDGIAGIQLLSDSLSTDPAHYSDVPFWARARNVQLSRQKNPKRQKVALKIRPTNWIKRTPKSQTTTSVFNAPITKRRALIGHTLPKAPLKKLSRAFEMSTGEAVLLLFARALHHHLKSQGALPKRSLNAFVPMSLRTHQKEGNQIAFFATSLATNQDARQCIALIKDSFRQNRAHFAKMAPADILGNLIRNYLPSGLNLATGFAPHKQVFNLVISTVPSHKRPLYWNGARLSHIYPLSVLMDGQALNITLTDHLGHLDIGAIYCPDVVDMRRFDKAIQEAMDELMALLDAS